MEVDCALGGVGAGEGVHYWDFFGHGFYAVVQGEIGGGGGVCFEIG